MRSAMPVKKVLSKSEILFQLIKNTESKIDVIKKIIAAVRYDHYTSADTLPGIPKELYDQSYCTLEDYDEEGLTPLYMAAKLDRLEVVEALLEAKAQPKPERGKLKGNTVLHVASGNCLTYLLKKFPNCIIINQEGRNPFEEQLHKKQYDEALQFITPGIWYIHAALMCIVERDADPSDAYKNFINKILDKAEYLEGNSEAKEQGMGLDQDKISRVLAMVIRFGRHDLLEIMLEHPKCKALINLDELFSQALTHRSHIMCSSKNDPNYIDLLKRNLHIFEILLKHKQDYYFGALPSHQFLSDEGLEFLNWIAPKLPMFKTYRINNFLNLFIDTDSSKVFECLVNVHMEHNWQNLAGKDFCRIEQSVLAQALEKITRVKNKTYVEILLKAGINKHHFPFLQNQYTQVHMQNFLELYSSIYLENLAKILSAKIQWKDNDLLKPNWLPSNLASIQKILNSDKNPTQKYKEIQKTAQEAANKPNSKRDPRVQKLYELLADDNARTVSLACTRMTDCFIQWAQNPGDKDFKTFSSNFTTQTNLDAKQQPSASELKDDGAAVAKKELDNNAVRASFLQQKTPSPPAGNTNIAAPNP